ncbi:MAG: rhomboid family intramembrane serine protease [Bacteroidota bacterium]|nr:rhomboid family intramembrane serine protease [Bacteroidota bacterium]
MAGFFSELKIHFKHGNALKRFIIANAVVFVVVGLFSVVNRLFLGTIDLSFYFSLPSQPVELMYRPWTLISYMFLHSDFFHILFNMLWLYWFGGLFLQLFTEKQLVALYFLGGLAGALMFLAVYNTLPFFANQAGLLQGGFSLDYGHCDCDSIPDS